MPLSNAWLMACLLATAGMVSNPVRADEVLLPRTVELAYFLEQEELPPPVDGAPNNVPWEEGLALEPMWNNSSGCESCGSDCVPGRRRCQACCTSSTRLGRFLCGMYESLCCPDPCYDPHWLALADSAFFVPAARPQSQQRIRWDRGLHMLFPDRAEYFWARADGNGLGPRPTAPALGERGLNYDEMSLYTEAAVGKAGVFFEMPYRSLDPEVMPTAAGFADLSMGTKTMLFDCELLQLTLQFRTYIPSANALKGLGTEHVSLEPSLLVGLNISPNIYFQGQLAQWIPLGGDATYEGGILHYHGSLNQVLFRLQPDVPLICTLEFNGWSFQDGAYTDPVFGTRGASNETYFSAGPGFRLVICDRIDFGLGSAFALSDGRWAEQLYRTEFRWRF